MDREEVYYAINKGVPNRLTLVINIEAMMRKCTSEEELSKYSKLELIKSKGAKRILQVLLLKNLLNQL